MFSKLTAVLAFSVVGVSWLPWFSKDDSTDEPNPTKDTAAQEVTKVLEPEPVEPTAPLLFPDPLPFHPTLTVSPLGMTLSSSCAGCHPVSFEQWESSAHHLGQQSIQWLDAIREYGDGTVCTSCHLPFSMQHEKLTTEIVENDVSRPVLEDNTAWSPTWQIESVGCASCHVREGVIIGGKTSSVPHPVRNSTELPTSNACATCHQFQLPGEDVPIYNTVQEWTNSAYASAGIQCQDCHMINGNTIGNGQPSHSMALTAKQGLTLEVETSSFRISRNTKHPINLVVHNTGVGHNWPGSSPFIEKSILLRVESANNKTLMKDILHPIGTHRIEEKAGPSIGVANSHTFESELNISSKHRQGWATLSIIYKKGDEEEVIDTIRIEIR